LAKERGKGGSFPGTSRTRRKEGSARKNRKKKDRSVVCQRVVIGRNRLEFQPSKEKRDIYFVFKIFSRRRKKIKIKREGKEGNPFPTEKKGSIFLYSGEASCLNNGQGNLKRRNWVLPDSKKAGRLLWGEDPVEKRLSQGKEGKKGGFS